VFGGSWLYGTFGVELMILPAGDIKLPVTADRLQERDHYAFA
jgi:hypothetical protein